MNSEMIGTFAALAGIIGFLPVIRKVYTTGITGNFTYANIAITLISEVLWIIYGIMSGSKSNLYGAGVWTVFYLYILFTKIKSERCNKYKNI